MCYRQDRLCDDKYCTDIFIIHIKFDNQIIIICKLHVYKHKIDYEAFYSGYNMWSVVLKYM